MKTRMLRILLLLTLGIAGSVQAVPIRFSIDGTVEAAAPGNIFGLDIGDAVTSWAIFDDSLLTGVGFETIDFGLGTGNIMAHELGAITFTESMDADFQFGVFPQLNFDNGIFDGWDMIADAGFNGAPADYNTFLDVFIAHFGGQVEVEGIWDVASARITRVPEPATLLLLAAGLLALGLRRRA